MAKITFVVDCFPPDDDSITFTPGRKVDALEITMHRIDIGIPDGVFSAVVSDASLCGYVVHVKSFDLRKMRAVIAALNKCDGDEIEIVARNPEPRIVT